MTGDAWRFVDRSAPTHLDDTAPSRILNALRGAEGRWLREGELLQLFHPATPCHTFLQRNVKRLRDAGFPIESHSKKGRRFAPTRWSVAP
jgi:hypothetical protein